jgi:transposase
MVCTALIMLREGSLGAAAEAALTYEWSSGQVEGQVTKTKLVKRKGYGRSNIDLLQKRVLLAA